jgi:CBS domain-containing protein
MPHRKIRTIIEDQKVLTAPSTMSISDAADMMKREQTGALLVVEKKHLVGIFTERDALFRVIAEHRNPKTTRLADVMTPHPQTVDPDKPLGHALHMMYEGGFRNVPVVERGRLIGIVSARHALGPELKQFVAEMDERQHVTEILG